MSESNQSFKKGFFEKLPSEHQLNNMSFDELSALQAELKKEGMKIRVSCAVNACMPNFEWDGRDMPGGVCSLCGNMPVVLYIDKVVDR